MRRILAIGGGGFLMENAASPIDKYLRELTGNPRPRICLISTPSGDAQEHIDAFYKAYSSNVCEPSNLAVFRKPAPGAVALSRFEEHLIVQDAIFVGGGNTKSALGAWREWGIDSALSRAYTSGVLLAGMSAGAMCWFECGLTDSYWGVGYRPLKCLGLLPGGCGVHYHVEPERRSRIYAAIEIGAIPASVAIDDFAAILYEDEKPVRTLRWRIGAGAYSVSLRAGQVVEEALECVDIDIAET